MAEYFAHESCYVDDHCEIGDGTKIWHFTHVMTGARIGRRCNIGQNVVISPDVVVGDNVKIQNNVSVYTGVVLEDDVFCGPSMVFTNVINPRSHVSRKDEYQPTLVKRGATLGANSTIVCGHTIGSLCLCRGRYRGHPRRSGLRARCRESRADRRLGVPVRCQADATLASREMPPVLRAALATAPTVCR